MIFTIAAGLLYPVVSAYDEQKLDSIVSSNHYRMQQVGGRLSEQMEAAITQVRVIAALPSFSRFLKEPSDLVRQELENTVWSLSHRLPDFSQIRFLDNTGQELWRVNHNGVTPEIVAIDLLQDKSDRYYFADAIDQPNDSLLISPLDLNQENGEIENPWVPTLRFALTVRDSDNQLDGVLVVNYRAQMMLDRINQFWDDEQIITELLNSDGYWLVSSEPQKSFGFLFTEGQKLKDLRPELWRQIRQSDSGYYQDEQALHVFHRIYPVSLNSDLFWVALRSISSDTLPSSFFSSRLGELVILVSVLLLGATSVGLAALILSRRDALELQTSIARDQLKLEEAERIAAQVQSEQLLNLNEVTLQTLRDVVITADAQGVIRSANQSIKSVFGYEPSEVLGQNITLLMPAQTAREHPDFMNKHLIAFSEHYQGSVRHQEQVIAKKSNGVEFPLSISLTRTKMDGEILFVAALSDVTEKELLSFEREQFQSTLNSTLDCIFMFDAQSLRFTYFNDGAVQHTGYERSELYEMHPYDITPEFDEHQFRKAIQPLLLGEVTHLTFKTIHQPKTGKEIPVEIFLQYVPIDKGHPRFVAIVRDITHQEEQNKAIEKMALYDSLTGLPNRRFIRHKLEAHRAAIQETNQYAAVMICDLDEFKYINDTHGHAAGDMILRELGQRIADQLSKDAIIARLGGDEFLILHENLGEDRLLAEKRLRLFFSDLRELISQPVKSLAIPAIYSSMGAVLFNDSRYSVGELMRFADIAMYETKHSSKDGCSIFDERMHQRLIRSEGLSNDLKLALDQNAQIEAWFQPKLDNEQNWIGFETLVRWRHPSEGLIPPDDFLSLAESKNLMAKLGHRMLELSCSQFAVWRQRYAINDWTLSVNISQSQLSRSDFPIEVEQILKVTELPAERLILEVTESEIAENLEQSIEQINRLRLMGVGFSLDDFGTGFSSLSYLRQLPIDELKIDRSFVNDLVVDDQDRAIVTSIMQLAKALDLYVVAEGIENVQQFEQLKKMGCDLYQGFFFSRPLPASDAEKALKKESIIAVEQSKQRD